MAPLNLFLWLGLTEADGWTEPRSPKDYPAIGAWMERIKALPGWQHPYELMPGYPLVKG